MRFLRILGASAVALALVLPADATAVQAAGTTYRTSLETWRAETGDFDTWTTESVAVDLVDGALMLDPATAVPGADPYPAGGYYGGNFYNGGSFVVGQATSPETPTAFGFSEAIASWNAETPAGTWVEALLRARVGTRWTSWYNLGIWSTDASTVDSHSVRLQGDADGYVAVDTLVLTTKKKEAVEAFQLRLRLFAVSATASMPRVSHASVAVSTGLGKQAPGPGDSSRWNTLLAVPECSAMVYPDGGTAWASAAATSMMLGFFGFMPGPCEPRVRATATGVYDWVFDGYANWPFNTAYAAASGLEAYVARYTSLAALEPWIDAGVPVVFTLAWKKGTLSGAPTASSSGDVAVLVGFDATGNPVVNDPDAAADEDVQRTYLRGELEAAWLGSGGTVFLMFPSGSSVPLD